MNASSLIELDYSEIEASYDTEMWSWMSYCFANQNYDFLHGALGVAMHFKDNPRYIENTLLRLEETAVKTMVNASGSPGSGKTSHMVIIYVYPTGCQV